MPSKFPWSKSNKSQASVEREHSQTSLQQPAPQGYLPQQYQPQAQPQQQRTYNTQPPVEHLAHNQRHSVPLDRPTVNIVSPEYAEDRPPVTANGPQQQRYSYSPSQSSDNLAQTHEGKRGLRSKLGFGSRDPSREHRHHYSQSSPQPSDNQQSHNPLGRRISLRKKETQPVRYTGPSEEPQYGNNPSHWSSRQSSSQQLATSPEEDEGESDLDPYLVRPETDSPKTRDHKEYPPQGLGIQASQQQRDPYQPPSRVSTDQSLRSNAQSTSGVSDVQYSPADQQPSYQQQQGYIAYSQPPQYQGQQQFQAYQAGGPNGPRPEPRQTSQDPTQRNSYHQQQQQQQPQGYEPRPSSQQQIRPPSAQREHSHSGQTPVQYQAYPPQSQAQVQRQQDQVVANPGSQHVSGAAGQQQQATEDQSAGQPSSGQRRSGEGNGQADQKPLPIRESSKLAAVSTPNQPLVSPGLSPYSASVVPTQSQGQPYKGEQGHQQQSKTPEAEPGRDTPGPGKSPAPDMTEDEVAKLVKDHRELRDKYQKVKKYYFEKDAHVQQLQNTLAHQRLSQSKTSLDDGEYVARFERLHGLISQLAFNIRKDWKTIPSTLQAGVNKDALSTGKQEMTAVGRAFMASWIYDEIFDKYFHPDLEPGLSTQLQIIRKNIRRFAPPSHSIEEEEGLMAKISNWRLTTLEGLQEQLRSPQAAANRQTLTETLNEKLIAAIELHLQDPPPPDLKGGIPMIIELAIRIASNLPLESRDVHIEYYTPGYPFSESTMNRESGCPVLVSPMAALSLDNLDADRLSIQSTASDVKDSEPSTDPSKDDRQDKKRGMFGNLMGGSGQGKKGVGVNKQAQASQSSLQGQRPGSSGGQRDGQGEKSQGQGGVERVRLCGGFVVLVRGKSVLCKAPCFVMQ